MFAKVWNACSSSEYAGRTVTVKLEYADFQQVTRSRSHHGRLALCRARYAFVVGWQARCSDGAAWVADGQTADHHAAFLLLCNNG